MKRAFIILGIIFFATTLFANDTVIVHKDPRLDILTTKQVAINKLTSKMTSSGMFKGYRIQVLNTRSRDEAFNTKANLLQNFADQKAYVLYQSPYFKVRIGNFLERADAEKFKIQLTRIYHQSVYVIADIIEYTPKEEE